jgi:hypothetical protein
MERLLGAALGGGIGGLIGGALAFATCEKSSADLTDPSYICEPGPRLYESMEIALAAHAGFFGLVFLIGGAWLKSRNSNA